MYLSTVCGPLKGDTDYLIMGGSLPPGEGHTVKVASDVAA